MGKSHRARDKKKRSKAQEPYTRDQLSDDDEDNNDTVVDGELMDTDVNGSSKTAEYMDETAPVNGSLFEKVSTMRVSKQIGFDHPRNANTPHLSRPLFHLINNDLNNKTIFLLFQLNSDDSAIREFACNALANIVLENTNEAVALIRTKDFIRALLTNVSCCCCCCCCCCWLLLFLLLLLLLLLLMLSLLSLLLLLLS
jgi:hypothetical protein